MLLDYFRIATGGLALFLIGANVAFLAHLGYSLLQWFQFKIYATTLLLVYVATSVFFGGVGIDRTALAAIALVIDAIAIWRMWSSILTINGGTFPPVKAKG